jgi:O-antigen ligase
MAAAVEAATPDRTAMTPGASAAPATPIRRAVRDVWRDLVQLRSHFGAVTWSLTFIGILGYIFAAVTYRLPIGEASIIAALAGLLLVPGGLRFPASAGLFVAFLLWAGLGALFSPWRSVAFDAWLELGKVGLIYLAIVNGVRTRSQIWFFMVAFLALYGSHPVRGTLFNYVTGNTYFGRAAWYQGIFSNPNDLAALTILQLSMAAALLLTEKKGLVRLGALFAVAVLPFTIIVTQSRAVLLALGVFVIGALWSHPKRFKFFMILLVLGTALAFLAPKGVWDRLSGLRYATSTSTLNEVDEMGSAEQRWEIWQTGMRIFKAHPVSGIGLGAYRYANGSISEVLGDRDAHSTYITLLAENGVIGLALFLLLVGATLMHSRSVRRRIRRVLPEASTQLRFLELGLLCFMIAAIWGSYSKLTFFYVHIALIWSLATTAEREAAEARRIVLRPGG